MSVDLDNLRQRLADDPERIAIALLGEPTDRTARELRYGRKGSLVVTLTGEKAGLWNSFEDRAGGDMIELVRREFRCTFAQAVDWLTQILGEATIRMLQLKHPPKRKPTSAASDKLRWSPDCEARWRSTVDLDETYFLARNTLPLRCADVRFHPAVRNWKTGTTHPAVVSRVTDFATGAPLTLHYIFLNDARTAKASIAWPKLLLYGHVSKNGIIRAVDDSEVTTRLGLAEGLETTAALLRGLDDSRDWMPIWSTVSAGTMADLPVVAGIEQLTIYADNDARGTGLSAARSLAARWHEAGREVWISTPPRGDWNQFREVAA